MSHPDFNLSDGPSNSLWERTVLALQPGCDRDVRPLSPLYRKDVHDVYMDREHRYRTSTVWTGNLGTGTSDYRAYSRDHEISGAGKSAVVQGSSDPVFRGNASRYNPEELLVASLSACHMLTFLHLCADAGIVVTDYRDDAEGTMTENEDGSGQFSRVTLRPRVTIEDASRTAEAEALHQRAHQLCFIARSVNFPVEHAAVTLER